MKIELSLTKREAEAVVKGMLVSTWKDREGGLHASGTSTKTLKGAEVKLKRAVLDAAVALRDTGGQA